MRKVEPCPCAKAASAQEPEEYTQLAACAEAALVIAAASKITKIKSAFKIFQSPLFSGPYSMSTFKVLSQGFITREIGGGTVSRSMCRLRVAATAPLLYWGANLEQGATCTRTGDNNLDQSFE